jgi:hypothetical protein
VLVGRGSGNESLTGGRGHSFVVRSCRHC